MTYKTIFKGRLEFGSQRSYDKVLKMYQHRLENYYKSDVLLNEEDIFDEEASCLNVPRFITQGSEKSWKNTLSMLEFVAQFAVAGNMRAWMTNEGTILHHEEVEPTNDRVSVQAFLKGRKLSKEKGKEPEAMAALTKAIEKYERHAQAYERRGYVNYLLKNYKEALEDYNKSIDVAPYVAEGYFGRALVKKTTEDIKGAINDYSQAIKMSMPVQPLYWNARRKKIICHFELGNYEDALQDLSLFTKRRFTEDNPNFKWKKFVQYQYGIALAKTGDKEAANEMFEAALNTEHGTEFITNDKILKAQNEEI